MNRRVAKASRSISSLWVTCKRLITANKWAEYGLVALAFLVLAIILTGGVIFHASNQLFTNGIGDATSGFTWVLFAQNHLPLFSQHSQLVNYPYGENVLSPQYVTSALIYGPLYILARVFSALTAMNIITLVGFVSCGLVMYIVVKRLTDKWYLAFFAAYAATFMPYHLLNATTHNTNVFSGVFIAIIAAFVAFWRRQTFRRGLLLAVSIAAASYIDGYFIFISGVLLFTLIVSVVVTDLVVKESLVRMFAKLRRLCIVGLGTLVLLLPVLLTQVISGGQIQQSLSNVRSNIKSEVAQYSVEPVDLLLPAVGNVLIGNTSFYQHYYDIKNKHSNDVENTNYIGIILLLLGAAAFVYTVKFIVIARKNKKKGYATTDYVMAVCIIAAPLALLWMLPPMLFNIKMPIGYLTDHVAYWRVPARVFLVVQPMLVIAAVLALNKFIIARKLSKKVALIITAAILCLTALEFSTNAYRPAFGFKDMPKAYTWLAAQQDVHVIAEVPIVDRPLEITGYYIFAQMIHDKPIVNDQLSRLAPGQLNTLGDLSNPETLNFIRSRGADTIINHTKGRCESYDWGRLVYTEAHVLSPPFMDGVGTTLCVYKLHLGSPADGYYAYAEQGFQAIDYRDKQVRYWLILGNNHPTLRVVDNQGRPIKKSDTATFTAELSFVGKAPEKQLNWSISQRGKVIATGSGMKDTNMSATIDTALPINITVTTDSFNRVPLPGEVDMRGVKVAQP